MDDDRFSLIPKKIGNHLARDLIEMQQKRAF